MRIGTWPAALLPAALLLAVALWLRAGGASGNVPPAELDVTGTWNVTFSGDFSFSCEVQFQQDGDDLSGTYNCPNVGQDTFSGTIKQQGPDVVFTLHINAFGSSVTLNGTISSDGNSSSGTWGFGIYDGTFSGSRKGAPTPAPTATSQPTATNTAAPTNTPAPGATATATRPPTVVPTPAHTPTPAGQPGDVNCAGGVNSIDATLTLQFGAGLVSSLLCQANADVNHDGSVNSLDAALILQFVAGLLSTLPV